MIRLGSSRIIAKLSLQSQRYLNDVFVFEELDSTNSWLLERKGCYDVCLAEKQRAGRGRRGRRWSSPAVGNIYMSLSWCFNGRPDCFSMISLITGVAICEALEANGLRGHGLKWPNDILVEGKKLAGILVETSGSLQRVVIGIGLNVFSQPYSQQYWQQHPHQPDNQQTGQFQISQPWCALDELMDGVPERQDLIADILNQLVKWFSRLDGLDFNEFKSYWDHWDIALNQPVTIIQTEGSQRGVVRGIDQQGCILVEGDDGVVNRYFSGEVSLRW